MCHGCLSVCGMATQAVKLYRKMFACLTPTQCGEIFLVLAQDILQSFKTTVRWPPRHAAAREDQDQT